MADENGKFVEWWRQGKIQYWENNLPLVPVYQRQVSHGLIWDQLQVLHWKG
jgi:hypothetical protein